MPELTDVTIPTLFHYFLQPFFYVDYGIQYEELLVRAKKHKSCCITIQVAKIS